MIDYFSAQNIVKQELIQFPRRKISADILFASGEVLAEDVVSDINLPPFDNSAMDGFAVKYNIDIRNWSITAELSAGNYSSIYVNDISAVQIMTGAKLPEGCDTVLPVEDVIAREGEIILNTGAKYSRGMNVRKTGEDLEAGKIAIEKNTLLKPHHIALAAACGKTRLQVYEKIRIGVLATGDELVDIAEVPKDDKIRATNLYALISAVKEMNQAPVNLGICRDNKKEIHERIASALNSDLDILVTTGGVSVGEYDFVKDILAETGVDIKFSRVNIKPGKPLVFGVYKKQDKTTLIFGLPGNPVSSMVTFILFVKNNILTLYDKAGQLRINAVLDGNIAKDDGKRHFVRGFLSRMENGDFSVSVAGKQSSGNLAQMSRANCLITVEEERINLQKGDIVECILI